MVLNAKNRVETFKKIVKRQSLQTKNITFALVSWWV
jgi:hypothetical protein